MFHPLPSSDPSPGRLLWCQQIQETDAGNLALTVETLSSRHLHALCEGRVQLHRLAKFSAEIVPQHALLSTGCNVKLFKYIYILFFRYMAKRSFEIQLKQLNDKKVSCHSCHDSIVMKDIYSCFYCEVSEGLQRPAAFWESGKTYRLDLALSAHMILLHVRKAFLFGSDCRFHSFTQLSTSLNHGH